MQLPVPIETFPALGRVRGLSHAFTGKIPGLDVKLDRSRALQRLDEYHQAARRTLGLEGKTFVLGEQVHGREIAVVDAHTATPVTGVDGLLTADPATCLGVYVADCCAVYLVDPVRRVLGLLHSGRKGSELGITAAAISRLQVEFGCRPADLVIQLSPCIRPPHYETDFAALIIRDCVQAGVGQIADCGTSTAAHPDRYYSYRLERGKTGRMLALLAFADS